MTRRWLPGLCSVTFRDLDVDVIVTLATEHGIRAVEWGADVHVPPGELDVAAHVREISTAAGIEYLSYGSYLLAAKLPTAGEIDAVFDTAAALTSTNVRVWTPLGVAHDSPRRGEVVAALADVAAAAANRGMTVSLEYHGGTLTATAASTTALLTEVAAANLFCYWQPSYWIADRSVADDAHDVRVLSARLAHFHVYEWDTDGARHALAAGADRWPRALGAIDETTAQWAGPRVAFLEFVAHDSPEAFRRDAATLCAWIETLT
jgi:3-dehydroshikimate dehydratase